MAELGGGTARDGYGYLTVKVPLPGHASSATNSELCCAVLSRGSIAPEAVIGRLLQLTATWLGYSGG